MKDFSETNDELLVTKVQDWFVYINASNMSIPNFLVLLKKVTYLHFRLWFVPLLAAQDGAAPISIDMLEFTPTDSEENLQNLVKKFNKRLKSDPLPGLYTEIIHRFIITFFVCFLSVTLQIAAMFFKLHREPLQTRCSE